MNEPLHSEPLTIEHLRRFAPESVVVNMSKPVVEDFTIVELAVLLGFIQMKLKEERYKSDKIFESIARKARARIASVTRN